MRMTLPSVDVTSCHNRQQHPRCSREDTYIAGSSLKRHASSSSLLLRQGLQVLCENSKEYKSRGREPSIDLKGVSVLASGLECEVKEALSCSSGPQTHMP